MRFLWMSNAPWAGTGYGVQTKLLLKALQGLGHEPSCFAFYGLEGGKIEYDGYDVYPNSNFNAWGNDVIEAHLQNSHSNAVITLMDVFVLDSNIWRRLAQRWPWAAWVPVDSHGIGFPNLERLEFVTHPVAMSQHGAQQMLNHGIVPAAVIPHAVDTEVFKPLDKWECREELGIEKDAWLVGMVMANKGDRKQYPQQFEALKVWSDKNPDVDLRVYLHTEPTHQMGGWDMKELIQMMGLKGRVYASNQYFSSVTPLEQATMAKIYNAMDVLMNVSAGEGFGVPIIEAQACGIPVITQNVSAMPEITKYGYAVEPRSKGLSSHYGWQFGSDPEDLLYRLDCTYRMFPDAAQRASARSWVAENCSIGMVAAQWHGVLTYMQEQMEQGELVPPEKVAS